MVLTIQNRQRNLRIDVPALRRLCLCLYALACNERRTRLPSTALDCLRLQSTNLTLCSDTLITRVHTAVFNDPTTTDVITIPYAPTPTSDATAEIFVNTRLARDSATEHNIPPSRELALYIAHAFDHLAGYDDRLPRSRDAMRRRELSWLDACESQGLLDFLRKI